MPPKDMEKISNNLLFKDVSGNITLFKQLEVVNIGDMDNQEMIETSSVDDMCIEINLKDIVPADGLTLNDLFFILFYKFDIEKVKKNNWRKLHRIPIRRKIK